MRSTEAARSTLEVDIPRLSADPVLLARLCNESARATAARAGSTSRHRPRWAGAAAVVAVCVVIGGTFAGVHHLRGTADPGPADPVPTLPTPVPGTPRDAGTGKGQGTERAGNARDAVDSPDLTPLRPGGQRSAPSTDSTQQTEAERGAGEREPGARGDALHEEVGTLSPGGRDESPDVVDDGGDRGSDPSDGARDSDRDDGDREAGPGRGGEPWSTHDRADGARAG